MDACTAFWNSPGYRDAVGCARGKAELDLVVALEGLVAGDEDRAPAGGTPGLPQAPKP